jgi:hypothetical protein
MKFTGLILALILSLSGCKNSKKNKIEDKTAKNDKKIHNSNKKPVKLNKNKLKWYVEGNYKLLNGSITSLGRDKNSFYGGETLVPALFIGNLLPGEDLTGIISVIGENGIYLEKKEKLVHGGKLISKIGVIQAYVGLNRSWPTGEYTLSIRLSQDGGGKGKILIPFKLKSQNSDDNRMFSVMESYIPQFPSTGSDGTISFLIRGLKFNKTKNKFFTDFNINYDFTALDKKIDKNENPKKIIKKEFKLKRKFVWGELKVKFPEKPGKYKLFFKITDNISKKTISFGEQIEIVDAKPGIFNISLLDSLKYPQKIWRRLNQGIVELNLTGFTIGEAFLDIAIIGPDGGAYFIKKRNSVKFSSSDTKINLPFKVPEFAKSGKFKIKLRIRQNEKIESREILFKVTGKKLKRSSRLRISKLLIGDKPYFLHRNQLNVKSNKKLYFSFIISGFKLKKEIKYFGKNRKKGELINIGLKCDLALNTPLIKDPVKKLEIANINKTILHFANNLRVNGFFKIPYLKPGSYFIKIDCMDKNSSRVTQLTRKVVIKKRINTKR